MQENSIISDSINEEAHSSIQTQKDKEQNNDLENFGIKYELEVCSGDIKFYINDVASVILTDEEATKISEMRACFKGIMLVMVSSRNNLNEIYLLHPNFSQQKADSSNKGIDSTEELTSQILLSKELFKGQLCCSFHRLQNELKGIIGLKNGSVIFIDPILSTVQIQFNAGHMVVDFVIENNYFISVGSEQNMIVWDLCKKERVGVFKIKKGSSNCVATIQRNSKGVYLAVACKQPKVQIMKIRFGKNKKQQSEESNHDCNSIQFKFLHQLNSFQIWNLTLDVIKEYTNTESNNWQDIPYECRNFSSRLLACGGSAYDSKMKFAIQLFDWKNQQLLMNITEGHKGWINSIKFFNHSFGRLIVGSADSNTTVYNVLTGQIEKRFEKSELIVMHALRNIHLTRVEAIQMGINVESDIFLVGAFANEKQILRIYF